jgi:phospholipid transport system substrate-binding protein
MAAAWGSLALAPATAAPLDATPVVERFHAALLQSMQLRAPAGLPERRALLAPVVEATFDLAFMGEKSVGRYWKDLPAPERERLVAALRELTVVSYAARFSTFSGERFETRGEEAAPQDTRWVRTALVRADGEVVQFDYRLRDGPAGPRVVDVLLQGTISQLALRRAEYVAVIERDGFAALLDALSGKIADLEAGRSVEP